MTAEARDDDFDSQLIALRWAGKSFASIAREMDLARPRDAAIWEMTSNHGRIVFCTTCPSITAASERVRSGCGNELVDVYANA